MENILSINNVFVVAKCSAKIGVEIKMLKTNLILY